MLRARLMAMVSFSLGCGTSPAIVTQRDADPAVLQGALGDWQEGPTDGRICLDPRVLPALGATDTIRERWADAVLEALLMDSFVAVDTTVAPRSKRRQRACTPTRSKPRIVVGRPQLRGDSADIETAVWEPVAGTDSGTYWRLPVVLARHGERWEIARRIGPSVPVIQLSPPR